jgi:diguanylate cyclase (GGDEF)-like protein/PAS domain S-box-containing protein
MLKKHSSHFAQYLWYITVILVLFVITFNYYTYNIAIVARWIIIALSILLIATLWSLYARLNTILGGSVDELQDAISAIGQGDFTSQTIDKKHAPQSVIGQLDATRDLLKHLVADLKKNQNYLSTIIENEPECVKLIDLQGNLLEMNAAGLALFEAQSLKEVQEHNLLDFILPQWHAQFLKLIKDVLAGEHSELIFEINGLNGTHRWLETHASPMHDDEGVITGLVGITRDITQRKLDEQYIHQLAYYDTLTGLANRTRLDEYFSTILNISKRNHMPFVLLILDLDHFKEINDTHGHHIGDQLLQEAAKRFKSCLRHEDMVARFGGDEFVILLPGLQYHSATVVAKKLVKIIQEPFMIQTFKLNISLSLGIAHYPQNGENFDTLFKNADTALYCVKNSGRNGYHFFRPF